MLLLDAHAENPLSKSASESNDATPEAFDNLDMVDAMKYTDAATASNAATFDKKAEKIKKDQEKKQKE